MPTTPKSAGYSGTPLPKKLGLKEASRVLLSEAPPGFAATLGELPAGARVATKGQGPFDVVVWFCRSVADLERGLASRVAATGEGTLWICWPKKASGVATDLTESVVQRAGLDAGLVDSKVAAVDETWSGLRFTRRRGRG
jgi:hypothetical protein